MSISFKAPSQLESRSNLIYFIYFAFQLGIALVCQVLLPFCSHRIVGPGPPLVAAQTVSPTELGRIPPLITSKCCLQVVPSAELLRPCKHMLTLMGGPGS